MGELFIVSSPSGGGKTTLIRRVMQLLQGEGRNAYFSVSHTTRPPRPGERHGVDYYFVSREQFAAMVDRGEFLEYAEVHGNLYGTAWEEVAGKREAGWDVFLDIDVQGARQVRGKVPDAVKVFIFPPSYGELRRRLEARRQDVPETIRLRMRNALNEMREYGEFDYVIINDELEVATRHLYAIVTASRLRSQRMRGPVEKILDEYARHLKEEP
ncbi:MAG: guanylate kinase [Thermoanaerobaculum sp.]|nr:guanylate kinase [Thermoanaerobaculum sp.]MDW7967539.1 guanylate kinase [Thermoanaerobaculum sp.]